MEIISQAKCYGGTQFVCSHASKVCGVDMTFAAYIPPQAENGPVPVLFYLSGLTCSHENALTKAGLQEHAAKYGIAVVFPDTSPRGEGVADDEAYDLGIGAGFYVNATQEPWKPHFQMYDYIVTELRECVLENLPVCDRMGITGHSMGGHGALTIAFKNPDLFQSVSAFAPIANPTQSDWGRKQLSAYLGDDESVWADHDATMLLQEHGWQGEILVDQGTDDPFIDLLRPSALSEAMAAKKQASVFRMQAGYDHSYYFVSTFGEDHIRWHAERL